MEKTGTQKKTHVILNPSAGGGQANKNKKSILQFIGQTLGNTFSFHATQKPMDACFSARSVLKRGAGLIIAIGGDGTIQETVNGFFDNGRLINPVCQLAIINCGTGQGFARSLGLPQGMHQQMAVALNGEPRAIDIGRVTYNNGDGRRMVRYFVNECQVGIGGAVVESVGSAVKRLGGGLAFGLTAISKIFTYPDHPLTVTIDKKRVFKKKFIGVVMANGNYMAGGMKLTPGAKMDDHSLDVLMIHEQTLFQRLLNFPKIYSGSHLQSSKFTCLQGSHISLKSPKNIQVEADGELLGSVPCTIEVLPSAIQIRVGKNRESAKEEKNGNKPFKEN